MYHVGHPNPSDIEDVFKFLTECDIEEFGEPDSSREDLEEQWSDMDLQQDAWVAYDEKEKMIGYACVSGQGERYGMDLIIDRKATSLQLEDELAGLCVNRGKELAAAKQAEKAVLTGYTTGDNLQMQQVYERNGFIRKTFHYRMHIDFDQPPAPVVWPDNISLSNYTEKDEGELYALINSAFTWRGREIPTIESWRSLIFRGGHYDPRFFVLLRDSGKLVGAALGYAEDAGGWIRQLAVAPEYQGKGLGGLLLRHMFYLFSQAGMKSTALGVASENSNACQFYIRNGMKKSREFVEYRNILC
jgi:ribosomal protein S18 acetylase RimI-like enzyme